MTDWNRIKDDYVELVGKKPIGSKFDPTKPVKQWRETRDYGPGGGFAYRMAIPGPDGSVAFEEVVIDGPEAKSLNIPDEKDAVDEALGEVAIPMRNFSNDETLTFDGTDFILIVELTEEQKLRKRIAELQDELAKHETKKLDS